MPEQPRRSFLSADAWLIACLAVVNIVFHLVHPEYGFHRDELYYVAIADGFSFSNLDMPPGAPLYLKLFLLLFGHSLKVVHLAASACISLVIVFACLTVKELGGKRYAMLLTGIFLLFSGLDIFGSLYTYDGLSFVVWAGVLYLIARMLNGADQRLWLAAGVLLGVGMLTKLTILFLGLAVFVSLWMVPARRWFRAPWIWLAALMAAACGIPYALWQASHGWYFLSYASSYAGRTSHASPLLDFAWNQFLPNNPATMPVWGIGLGMLLFRREWSRFRFFGICYLVLLVLMFVLGGQFYFMIPMYSVLIGAGAATVERWLGRGTRRRLAARIAVPAAYALLSIPALPFFVPLLSPEALVAYVRPVGVTAGIKTEDSQVSNLPQHMADRFGWETMAGDVARIYHEAEREVTGTIGVAAGNWGEASALHVYGRELGLPEPICGDGWFWFEGLRRDDFRENYVVIGTSGSQLRSLFARVERKGTYTNRYCRPNENNNAIFLCSHPRGSMRAYWLVIHRMEPVFAETLRRGGVREAADYFHRRRQEDSSVVLFSEQQMNGLGYGHLRRGDVKDALVLFRLNVEAYPESFNVYDSYGEALMADRQYLLAADNYRRSLELNPGNDNGRKKLAELDSLLTGSSGAPR